ncbi:cell division cycle-associated protein 3 [Macrotis lagotis]|uniref:cell division cycle-associated protein 3 n=1 Tax=Macrotis lagotis TaxID=92651 RepID=UPI003D68600B
MLTDPPEKPEPGPPARAVRMGSAKSVPTVPATPGCPAPRNKHLAHVTDPRSPSAGILRTPIQVKTSPQPSPSAMEQQQEVGTKAMEQPQDSDPRSPSFGIIRTPMKTSTVDPLNQLVKQLSEAFGVEASKSEHSTELALPVKLSSQPEQDLSLDTPLALEHQKLLTSLSQTEVSRKQANPTEVTEQPPAVRTTSQDSDKFLRSSDTPCSSGSRPPRRKPTGKVLGRSPLTTLQDDNSPGPLMPRQSKRTTVLNENVGERKEGAILGTGHPLKITGRAWDQGHNKENQHCPLVEN